MKKKYLPIVFGITIVISIAFSTGILSVNTTIIDNDTFAFGDNHITSFDRPTIISERVPEDPNIPENSRTTPIIMSKPIQVPGGIEIDASTFIRFPYIDFSNDPDTDYDGRIILSNDDTLRVSGAQLTVDGGINSGNSDKAVFINNDPNNSAIKLHDADEEETPYIAFSSGNDRRTYYDAKISLTKDDSLKIEGADLIVTENIRLSGDIISAPGQTICIGACQSGYVLGNLIWSPYGTFEPNGRATIEVFDPDESYPVVHVWSDSDVDGIDVKLVFSNSENDGVFWNSITFTTDESDDTIKQLKVADGDTVTAEYIDKTLPYSIPTDEVTRKRTITVNSP